MTSIAAGDGAELGPAAENQGRRRAAGIYGAIITAAIGAAQLQGRKLLFATLVAAGLGLVMILLKDLVLLHLH